MRRRTWCVHKFSSKLYLGQLIFLFLVLHIGAVPLSRSSIVSACKVNNMVLQPHFGISAKTKRLVDIVQIPPVFTQSIQIEICEGSNDNLNKDNRSLKNLPRYICRQRYKAVEVYTNPIKLRRDGPAHESHANISQSWLSREFERDFVIVESGCDFFFNFFPLLSSPGRDDKRREDSHWNLGISSISGVTLHQPHNLSNHPYRNADHEAKPTGKPNFFRRGLHLNPASKEHNETDSGIQHGDFPTMNHVQNGPTEEKQRNTTLPALGLDTDGSEEDDGDDVGVEIRPEELGLPILILEVSLDPVMKILSQFDTN